MFSFFFLSSSFVSLCGTCPRVWCVTNFNNRTNAFKRDLSAGFQWTWKQLNNITMLKLWKNRWTHEFTWFILIQRITRFKKDPSTGRIWKRNNHWPSWTYVWGKLGQGNHRIKVTPSFSTCFSCARERKAGFLTEFVRSEERFERASFLFWIRVDCRPNRRNKAASPEKCGRGLYFCW